ncbi:uncharacterized protein ASPGLDRAFT_47644 [Aspergillus glaucus CBS 516.65]|uniref:DUF7770 domain-containing protein n=1 Tax=Aspergillus glaucus CBS 516.65 TaxID=1160497 RepID=A0A1L9VJ40_ASPGL|nr:hypothetical protein ASPGLDRAFT_47644 [Aspergillus glaucus CBS 516.65]OJJ83937.1 hypothetical protein ASPGLDRAFT_47644 [Aspergillus glaucus CBS 516.65]
MTTFKTTHFIPSKHQPQILSSPITRILAVAHEQQVDTNHWCFYLQTSPESSICLDCQPSYSVPSTAIQGGSKANLILSELLYLLPPGVQAHFALDVVPGLTVAGVYEKLVEHGRHEYEFDSKGVGCRFWVTEQMDLLLRLGVVTDEKQVSAAKEGILLLWPDQTPNPLDQGAYYQ